MRELKTKRMVIDLGEGGANEMGRWKKIRTLGEAGEVGILERN